MVVIIAMKMAISKLIQLGFSDYEARAYVALLQDNPLTAYEISKKSGIPSSKVYEVIRKLENRSTVQSIQGERSKLFMPISPDEFAQNYRLAVEDNLHFIKKSLKGIKVGIDTNYTWHIKHYDDLIIRAKRMLRTARKTVLIMIWPEELSNLLTDLQYAQDHGVNVAMVHYGATNTKVGQVYCHPAENTIYAKRNVRGFTLVIDSVEAVTGKIINNDTEAIWSMNEAFVIITEDYLRHDIYFIKTMKRFDPTLQKKFGTQYEKLFNVYADEEL